MVVKLQQHTQSLTSLHLSHLAQMRNIVVTQKNHSSWSMKLSILPYLKEQRKSWDDQNNTALLIIDVFRGQMMDPVT